MKFTSQTVKYRTPCWQAIATATAILFNSSGARGGGERGTTAPFIGLKTMQNIPFLAFLRPIFALKMKIVPPLKLATRISQGPDINSISCTFFWVHQNLDRKTDSIWVKTDQNLGPDRLMLFPASKTAPPPMANSWLRACFLKSSCVALKCNYAELRPAVKVGQASNQL